jgi:cobalt-zinc-cadmium efflux system outer membrane protein
LLLAAYSLLPSISAAPSFTVDDAVAVAIQQNPRLRAAIREVGAAEEGRRSARAPANPELTFTPAVTPGGSDEELLLRQPLELNGARSARTGVAGSRLRAARAEAVALLREVVFETKLAYYELARAEELHTLAGELLHTAEEVDRITRRQVEAGARPGIDQTQTGIEVVRVRQQVTLAESQLGAARAALNLLLARPLDTPTGPLPPLTPAGPSVDRDAAFRQALSARGEIAAAEATQEALRGEARLARAEGRPDLVPQFRVGRVVHGFDDSGVGIGVSLPLFDYGSRRHRIRQAEAQASAQEARAGAVRNQVRREVEQALLGATASETVLREYQAGVLDQARRLLDASRTGFQAGATSVIAVLEAQRTYRALLTEYANALATAAIARAELERATGAFPAERLPAMDDERRPAEMRDTIHE